MLGSLIFSPRLRGRDGLPADAAAFKAAGRALIIVWI